MDRHQDFILVWRYTPLGTGVLIGIFTDLVAANNLASSMDRTRVEFKRVQTDIQLD